MKTRRFFLGLLMGLLLLVRAGAMAAVVCPSAHQVEQVGGAALQAAHEGADCCDSGQASDTGSSMNNDAAHQACAALCAFTPPVLTHATALLPSYLAATPVAYAQPLLPSWRIAWGRQERPPRA